MFRPGNLEVIRDPVGHWAGYRIDLAYEVEQREWETYVRFDLKGEIDGRSFHECFELHRDVAYNFLHSACRCLRRHGFEPRLMLPLVQHREYERVFADLREKLHAVPGTPVDLERFLLERP